nr:uncharacterized protein LOC112008739 [Quercus suber]
MSNPKADEVLYAYIAMAPYAISLVLIRDDNDVQKLVYYVSKSLHEAEVKYLPMEKAILAVGNRQAEAVNNVIVNGFKKRLDDAKGRWVEELPHVLWTYQTTYWGLTGETPFAMTYEVEAVIPLEANFPTLRTSSFTLSSNDELLGKSLDLIAERREKAMIQLAYYHQKLKQRYNANVKLRPLAPGDLVLRKVVGVAKNPSYGKLGPNWEGPYRITSVAGVGVYYLEDLDERSVPRP